MAINFMRSSAMSSLRREPRGRPDVSIIKLLVKGVIRRVSRPRRDDSRTEKKGILRRLGMPGTIHHSTMQDEPLLSWRLLLFLLAPILFLLFFRGRLRSWLLPRRWRRSGLRRRRWLLWADAWRWGHCPWSGLVSVWIGPVRFRMTGFRRTIRLRAVRLRRIRPVVRWRCHRTIYFRALVWLRRR